MNPLEIKMVHKLKDLKENHHIVGVKAEFETEGSTFEETTKLKEIASQTGLELTIKIGGCGAIKDMRDTKTIGANTIVAPMIESPYAVKKYIEGINTTFSEEERKTMKFFINIETINGFNCLEEILDSEISKDLTGIVFGRSDTTGSLGMSKDDVNNPIILEYARKIAELTLKHNKELIIGGGVTPSSIPFFKSLPKGALSYFETRKIIFDWNKAIDDANIDEGISKAIDFELMWIKNKQEFYNVITLEDNKRIEVLERLIV